MTCTYIDLPRRFTAIPGKQLMKVEVLASNDDGAEVVYTYVTPKSVHEQDIAAAIDAVSEMDGRAASILAFKKAGG